MKLETDKQLVRDNLSSRCPNFFRYFMDGLEMNGLMVLFTSIISYLLLIVVLIEIADTINKFDIFQTFEM
jgi:hypothetical protein